MRRLASRISRLQPDAASIAFLIEVRQLAAVTVVIADVDRKRIASCPLNKAAEDAYCDVRIRLGVVQLCPQRRHSFAAQRSRCCEHCFQDLKLTPGQQNQVGHFSLPTQSASYV